MVEVDRRSRNKPGAGVCRYWLAGKCHRSNCKFLHPNPPNPNFQNRNTQYVRKAQESICQHWVSGNCSYGDRCRFLHSWCSTSDFSMFTRLKRHRNAVSGVVLPAGSEKLFSGDMDGIMRVWDCGSGQCEKEINLGCEVGCLVTSGNWVFAGLPNLIKGWCVEGDVAGAEDISLDGPVGQVYALVTVGDVLFAGVQDGKVLAWKFNFEPAVIKGVEFVGGFQGHTGPVVSLAVGEGRRLYSSSMDKTIRVWDLEQSKCVQTLTGHGDAVMSLLVWGQFLVSCSLDKTVLVWGPTESGSLEVVYTHKEEEPIIALRGMVDKEGKPVLFCSCKRFVQLYDLPSFSRRGKIFAKEIRAVDVGPDGLFFTGDGTGVVSVWKWQKKQNDLEA